MDKLTCKIEDLSEDRVSVEILFEGKYSLGLLYYENPKVGWTNKPIMSERWRCVDANIEGLKVYLAEDNESAKGRVKISVKEFTPKDLMVWAQEQVLLHKTKKNKDKKDEDHPSNGNSN